jgi:hypothetical protein
MEIKLGRYGRICMVEQDTHLVEKDICTQKIKIRSLRVPIIKKARHWPLRATVRNLPATFPAPAHFDSVS